MRPYHVALRRAEALASATPEEVDVLHPDECGECHEHILRLSGDPAAIVVCRECFPWHECSGVMTPPAIVIDPLVLGEMAGSTWRQPESGEASAIWVNCPRCRAHRGDPCRGDRFCQERLDANLQRMLDLPTVAVPQRTPCCGASVWLCWRSARDMISFLDVPCTKCSRTYSVSRRQSDFAPGDRHMIDRLHPHMMEMSCWALE